MDDDSLASVGRAPTTTTGRAAPCAGQSDSELNGAPPVRRSARPAGGNDPAFPFVASASTAADDSGVCRFGTAAVTTAPTSRTRWWRSRFSLLSWSRLAPYERTEVINRPATTTAIVPMCDARAAGAPDAPRQEHLIPRSAGASGERSFGVSVATCRPTRTLRSSHRLRAQNAPCILRLTRPDRRPSGRGSRAGRSCSRWWCRPRSARPSA